jgi:hypothetical protein
VIMPELVDCAHLHSVFGPGCPYCWRPAGPDGRAARGTRAPGDGKPAPAVLARQAARLPEPAGARTLPDLLGGQAGQLNP